MWKSFSEGSCWVALSVLLKHVVIMLPASFLPQQNWNWQQQRYIAFGLWEIVDKCYVIERLPVLPDDKVRTDSIRIAIVGEKHLELGTMKAYLNIPCIKDENWIDPTNPQVHASNHPLVLNGMDVQICLITICCG